MMKPAHDRPRRPGTRWHGAKWRLAPWIMEHMPTTHDVYGEGFGGSAAVLLQKPRSKIEVYNDLDREVFNYFNVLRDTPDQLIQAIQLTPYHKLEFDQAWSYEDELEKLDPVERARRFYVRAYMSIMPPSVSWPNSFRRQKKYSRGRSGKSSMKPAAISFTETSHLHRIAERLRGVTMECMDAYAFMQVYDNPNTLLYLDPPYLASERQRTKDEAYKHEMMTDAEHGRFLEAARRLQSMVLISGYASDLYADILETNGWQRYDKEARTNGDGVRVESLWLNVQAQTQLEKDLWQTHGTPRRLV